MNKRILNLILCVDSTNDGPQYWLMNFNIKSGLIFYDQRSHTQNQTRFSADVGLTTENSLSSVFPVQKDLIDALN